MPQRRNLPDGLKLQCEDNVPSNYSFGGKVQCNENNCNECKHIPDPSRHFVEMINPIIDQCKGDINKIAKMSISMVDIKDCSRFKVNFQQDELHIKPHIFKHFEKCHICFLYWNQTSSLDIIKTCIDQKHIEKHKNLGKSRRGKK